MALLRCAGPGACAPVHPAGWCGRPACLPGEYLYWNCTGAAAGSPAGLGTAGIWLCPQALRPQLCHRDLCACERGRRKECFLALGLSLRGDRLKGEVRAICSEHRPPATHGIRGKKLHLIPGALANLKACLLPVHLHTHTAWQPPDI